MFTRPAELKMESDQNQKIICVLCKKSDENEVTGPLSSKENISAHQNCLLFSSGIYCTNSPTYDDLFGFAVQDVINELRRGKKLVCHHCKKNGATAGCDLKRCMRSYHYPCAIKASASPIEDSTEGSYKLLCKRHAPDSKKSSVGLQVVSTSGLNDSHGRRSESISSTGSSEVSLSRKKNIDSDVEEYTPPTQHNQSTPDPKRKGPRDKLNPSATGSLNGKLTSDQRACGSDIASTHDFNGSTSNSPTCSPELETPRSKKIKLLVYSDDESPIRTDPVFSDREESVLPEQPNFPALVLENTRPCEKLNPSTTGADDDDTDMDSSDESQSLLQSEMYHITLPSNVIVDSGSSAESDSTPDGHHDSQSPSGQPGSPQHSRPTVGIPMMITSAVQTLPAPYFKLPKPSSPAGVSTSPHRADACDVNSTENSQSNASIFWTRCNQAGWTKEIFSELASQLSSLGERVQSQEASHQDYDVALKILEASGHLPCIITQLEQDLEKQEQDLQRKKAALRDARSVLGV